MTSTGIRNFLDDLSIDIVINGKTSQEIFEILMKDYFLFSSITNTLYSELNFDKAFDQIKLAIYDHMPKDDFIKLFSIEFKNKNKDKRLEKTGYFVAEL